MQAWVPNSLPLFWETSASSCAAGPRAMWWGGSGAFLAPPESLLALHGAVFLLHPKRMDESPDPTAAEAEPRGSSGAPWLRKDGEKHREEAQSLK